MAGGERF